MQGFEEMFLSQTQSEGSIWLVFEHARPKHISTANTYVMAVVTSFGESVRKKSYPLWQNRQIINHILWPHIERRPSFTSVRTKKWVIFFTQPQLIRNHPFTKTFQTRLCVEKGLKEWSLESLILGYWIWKYGDMSWRFLNSHGAVHIVRKHDFVHSWPTHPSCTHYDVIVTN